MTRDELIELLKKNFKSDEDIIFTEDDLDEDEGEWGMIPVGLHKEPHAIHLEVVSLEEEEEEEKDEEEFEPWVDDNGEDK